MKAKLPDKMADMSLTHVHVNVAPERSVIDIEVQMSKSNITLKPSRNSKLTLF